MPAPRPGVRDRASYVLEQGDIRIVMTSGVRADSEITAVRLPPRDAAKVIASRCRARPRPTARRSSAARGINEPWWMEDEFGRIEVASIGTYGEVIHCS